MSRISPNGPRGRNAPTVALALVLGALGLGALGCGGGGAVTQYKKMAAESAREAAPPDVNALNAEQYGAIVENEFRSPLVEPRSTFSYTNSLLRSHSARKSQRKQAPVLRAWDSLSGFVYQRT